MGESCDFAPNLTDGLQAPPLFAANPVFPTAVLNASGSKTLEADRASFSAHRHGLAQRGGHQQAPARGIFQIKYAMRSRLLRGVARPRRKHAPHPTYATGHRCLWIARESGS